MYYLNLDGLFLCMTHDFIRSFSSLNFCGLFLCMLSFNVLRLVSHFN